MKYKFPKQLIFHYESEVLNNKEGQIGLLALCLGYLREDTVHVQELIFPAQEGSGCSVKDKGNLICV